MTALSFVWVILTLKNSGCDNNIRNKQNLLEYICHAHQDGGSSQGGTRHSLHPARRRGSFNFDDQLNSSTER